MMPGFRRTTGEITAQCDAGLISIAEARVALRLVAHRAQYDADYSDSLTSYTRWSLVATNARLAMAAL